MIGSSAVNSLQCSDTVGMATRRECIFLHQWNRTEIHNRGRRSHSPGKQCKMHSCIGILECAGKCPLPASNASSCPKIWTPSKTIFVGSSRVCPQINRFSCFCTAHLCAQYTHRHTDHATCDTCANRPHLRTACKRCGLATTSPNLCTCYL